MLHDLWFSFLILATSFQCVLTEDLVVCDRSRITAQFHIPALEPCLKHRSHTIGTCNVKIYNPKPNALKIPLFSCSLSITRWTSTHFFFGAKREKVFDPIYRPISVSRCNRIALTLQDEDLGKLVKVVDGHFGTRNPVNPSYVWPRGTSGEIFNVFFTNTSFIFEHTSRRMFSPVANLKNCEISTTFCSDKHNVFIWKFNETFLCPSLTESKDNSTDFDVELHYKQDGSLYYIEIPDMGLSFHRHVDCTVSIKSCFGGQRILCMPNGFVLKLGTCKNSKALDFFNLKTMKNNERVHASMSDKYNALTHNFMVDVMGTVLQEFDHSWKFVDCKIERSLTTMLALLGKSYPSEVLSLLLNRTVGAVSLGDTLGMLHCETKTVKILPYLKVGRLYSTRPLVEVVIRNVTKTYQIHPDGIAYKDIRFLESFQMNHDSTFMIGDHAYHFVNYTLNFADKESVIPIFPSLSTTSLNFPNLDFELFEQSRPTYDSDSLAYYSFFL